MKYRAEAGWYRWGKAVIYHYAQDTALLTLCGRPCGIHSMPSVQPTDGRCCRTCQAARKKSEKAVTQ